MIVQFLGGFKVLFVLLVNGIEHQLTVVMIRRHDSIVRQGTLERPS